MTELRGVIPITATPFDDDGRVDEESIITLVVFEARCGVHGKLEESPTPTKITALRRLPGSKRLSIFGGMNGMFFFEELSRGAVGIMTGVAVPDILVEVYDLFATGNVAGAAEMYDRYASYIRYEGQVGVGIALRKEVVRLRGAIRSSYVRPPGPALDDATRTELSAILERAGILSR